MSRTVNDSRLRVARFNATYFIARDHPAPDRLKRTLDDTVRKDLADALSTAMFRFLSPADESVWLIRRLDVNLDINASWNREVLANSWANQIERSLTVNLRSDADSQNVIRFPNRAAYLAAFLNDLANSNATGKWYYRSFDGLGLLPLSASLRTAICEDTDEGLRGLLRLDNYQINAVLRALSFRDAQRVLERLAEVGNATSNESACLRSLLAVCREARADHLETLGEANDVLRLCLAVCRTHGELLSPTLVRVATALARLRSLLENADPSGRQELITAVTSKDITTLYRYVGSVDGEKLAPLTRCPTDQVQELAPILLKRRTEVASTSDTGLRYTQFGGVFLLLPVLDAMPIDQVTEDWPPLSDTSAADIVRFIVVMHCCGGTRASSFFADALMRDLMNIPPTLSTEKLIEWHNEVTGQQLRSFNRLLDQWFRAAKEKPAACTSGTEEGKQRTRIAKNARYLTLGNPFQFSRPFVRAMRLTTHSLMRNFARKLPGFSTSGLSYLYSNFLDFPATLEDEPTRCVITLGRPPLNLILKMSGLNSGSYQLSFTGERTFALFERG